ncbi:MAG: bifunctional histidine phosphatase family protein/GNAT family N-acetyltransferase [Oscillospiraceae bacterium]|nr:bifunctional histidine phosphatase family protein/GNAT family N-acetyltransferase [Oscillospiraceae bacterium]
MTQIYLIRHAEAEGNVYRRAQGHYNGQITRNGRRQIEALAERFKDIPIDAVYSSNMDRTIQTAGAILKYHPLTIETDPGLREIYLGSWENTPWGTLTAEYPEQLINFNDDPDSFSVEGAERYPEVGARMLRSLTDIAKKHEGGTVAVVSHGSAIRYTLALIDGLPSKEMPSLPHGDNTNVSLITYSGDTGFKTVFKCDSSHLPSEISTLGKQKWWKKKGLHDTSNVPIIPFDASKDWGTYESFYSETWKCAHGTLRGYDKNIYLRRSQKRLSGGNGIISFVRYCGENAGIVEVDTSGAEGADIARIVLICVREGFRRSGLGIQLLGHAVELARAGGFKKLRLCVSEDNKNAIDFYREFDFNIIGQSAGSLGQLFTMEKDISI